MNNVYCNDIYKNVFRAKMAMEETLSLEEAVEVAMSLTKREETLIIVTADHSHAVSVRVKLINSSSLKCKGDNKWLPKERQFNPRQCATS